MKDTRTSFCINQTISVHIELKENSSQSFKILREDNDNTILSKSLSSQYPMGFISQTGRLTNQPFKRKCLYESHVEKQEKQAEEEAVNIPGQCC